MENDTQKAKVVRRFRSLITEHKTAHASSGRTLVGLKVAERIVYTSVNRTR